MKELITRYSKIKGITISLAVENISNALDMDVMTIIKMYESEIDTPTYIRREIQDIMYK